MKQNLKNVPLVKQNVMKLEVFILEGQRIDPKRKKGWWRGRRERIEKGSRDSAVKRCSSEVLLVSSGVAW